jgi:hypothetical protein
VLSCDLLNTCDSITRLRSDLLDDGIPDTLVSVALPLPLLRWDGRELVRSAVAYERQKQMAAAITNERTAAERTCPYTKAIRVGMFPSQPLPSDARASAVARRKSSPKRPVRLLYEWAGSMSDSGPATGVLAGDEKERPA